MAMPRRIKVDFGEAFPHGAYMFAESKVEQARDFDKSKPNAPVQAIDPDTELPVWTVEVMDADPEARTKAKAITVRIVSQYAPTLPETPNGWPVRPIELEGLTATAYVAESAMGRSQIAWSFRATGIREPKAAGGQGSSARSSAPNEQAAKEQAA